ncbi:type II toxin-antitoxin system SpoIISA family toxin [Evansella cellulosilytica]|uniref:Type II toxin-antitoxin system toxin SpoIISA n=1 Tax=Evansella cellulosilytica (strain ATCC 21833 / DSM 2522 / FERM P-1141 / JCM 9156 / N-4) TaxID=649639 RepID=E6TS07_EVAC2|nr:type II toxin-antitoxin system SpoIISA family toxin [Evansella cellulosilytica]ADU30661.1 hypothetical protein Bcell_2403 [Evansella cellulosilytica DSM 2522]
MDEFFLGYFLLIIAFLICSLIYYGFRSDLFIENLGVIRKGFYVLFIVLLCVGFLYEAIDYTNWKLILQLTVFIIFIDIAVFQTPNMLKFWSGDQTKSEYIEKTIKKNEETLGYNTRKVEKFMEVIQYSSFHFYNKTTPDSKDKYISNLKDYIRLYTDTFQFHISIFPFEVTGNDDELKESVRQTFSNVEKCYNYIIEDISERENIISSLSSGKSMMLKQDKLFIVSYFGEQYNLLICIKSEDVSVDGIDASHVINLAHIFDWWMVE